MITTKEIGNSFTKAREKRSLTIEDVSKKTRIQPGVLRDIENGVFDRLGKLYMKGFLKKYSDFLGIDAAEILRNYEAVSSETPEREFVMPKEKKEKTIKKEKAPLPSNEKKAQTIFVALLSVLFFVLLFVFVRTIETKFPVRAGMKVSGKAEKAVKARDKAAPRAKEVSEEKSGPFVLMLKARGKVWVRVSEGKKVLYDGFLEQGTSKSWQAQGALTVWTGKAEMLDFFVNTRKIGKISDGVVKNITVVSGGIKIGDSWVTRLE